MSALLPHIRVLRAEADALSDAAYRAHGTPAFLVLISMATAKHSAADALEAGQRELEAKLEGK